MKIIVIILVLVAVAFYARTLAPPEYVENLTDRIVAMVDQKQTEESRAGNNQQPVAQLRNVPDSQLAVIKQVFAPEMID